MGVGADGRRAGEKRRERERKAGVGMVWTAKSKPANHEAESAYVTGEGGAAENVMKFSEICHRGEPGGSLDCNTTAQTLLQYLNTPLREINKSPAQLATGRQLRDGVPVAKVHYRVERHWRQVLRDRETRGAEALEEILAREKPSRHLPPLRVGEQVRVQDSVSKLWNRMGLVVEARPHRQDAVRLA